MGYEVTTGHSTIRNQKTVGCKAQSPLHVPAQYLEPNTVPDKCTQIDESPPRILKSTSL